MYVFQFMDASWRIAPLTNSRFPLPVRGEAAKLYDGVYQTEREAGDALVKLRSLSCSNPEMFIQRQIY